MVAVEVAVRVLASSEEQACATAPIWPLSRLQYASTEAEDVEDEVCAVEVRSLLLAAEIGLMVHAAKLVNVSAKVYITILGLLTM